MSHDAAFLLGLALYTAGWLIAIAGVWCASYLQPQSPRWLPVVTVILGGLLMAPGLLLLCLLGHRP